MESLVSWPFRIFLSICGDIASLITDRNSINFNLLQMAVAILLITLVVVLAAHWPEVTAFLRRGPMRRRGSGRFSSNRSTAASRT